MDEWRPIDTASRDGTIILGCQGSGDEYQVFEMVWGDLGEGSNTYSWRDPRYDGNYSPTHWMPRPKPPQD